MRKRSRYKPRPVLLDTMGWIKNGMEPIASHSGAILNVRARNHGALVQVVQGKATRHDIDELIGAFNMTEALSWLHIGDDYSKEIAAALESLLCLARRGADSGKFIATGPELTAMNLGMEIHDAQLDLSTVAEVDRAIALIHKTYRQGKARKIMEPT